NLREVDLRYTRVTGGGVAALRRASPECQVAFLDVSAHPREMAAGTQAPAGNTPAAIAQWIGRLGGKGRMEGGAIREVSLASSRISDAQLAYLANLPELRKLNLEATEAGDVGLAKLGKSCKLSELNLSHTTVSSAGLRNLEHCAGLRKLDISYTLVD